MNIRKSNKNNGITLIALVITIIVMLILVAVTISMAINGGLFEKAGQAVGDTQNEINAEQQLANGRIKVGDLWYDSIDDYLNNNPSADQGNGGTSGGGAGEGNGGTGDTLPTYANAAKDKNGFLTEKAKYASDGYTAIIPKGYKVSEVTEEQAIGTGLVIKDANNNEFVWIPVTSDLGSSYHSRSSYSEPKELESTWSYSTNETKPQYDSQDILNELYGTNYYIYTKDFKYADEYAEMVRCVNANDGFYIGRYETTIDDDGSIGSKNNTTVLTAETTYTYNTTSYYYRWYGLYYAQKNANVTGNGTDVQTAMIYGVLWDKTMDFIRAQKTARKTEYDVDKATSTWHGSSNGHTGVVNSGQANKGTPADVALNIWDLESNAYEWTQEANSSDYRVNRGGCYDYSSYASGRYDGITTFMDPGSSSRLALYIK